MIDPITRRISVGLTIVTLLAVSTVAVAHGHPDLNSVDEAHCPLCIAVHRAKQAVTAPVATLCFLVVETPIQVPLKSLLAAFIQPRPAQGRSPPQL
jgi:hypothetical protein